MSKDSDEPWRVYGRIAGECLPIGELRLDNVYVGPVPAHWVMQDRPARPTFSPMDWPNSVSESADVRVRSKCYFWVSRRANSELEALDLVEREDLPRLQSVLSAHAGKHPYRVEIISNAKGNYFQPRPSTMAACAIFQPKFPPAELFLQVGVDMDFLARNEKVLTVFRHYADAIRQTDTAYTAIEQEAALLTTFKVIEGIANLIPVTTPENLKAEQDGIIDALLLELQKGTATEKKVKSVRAARDKLERLEIKFLDLKISNLARQLRISSEWEEHAKKFASFRNKRLGHAAPVTTTAEREHWFLTDSDTRALSLVQQLTKAYLDKVRK